MSVLTSAARRRHRFVSFALFLALGFHVGVWAVQLGSLSASLALDPGRLGLALSGGAAGGIVTLFAGGRIADRFGRRIVLVTGFGVTGLAFGALGAAQTFAQAAAAIVLYGLFISFVDLGANAVASDYEHAHEVEAMTGLQAGFSLGAVIGALAAAGALAAGVDHRVVYWALAAAFLVAAAAASRADLPMRSPTEVPSAGGARAVWRSAGVVFATVVVLVTFFGDGALEGFLAVFLRDAIGSGVLLSGIGIAGFHLASFAGRSVASALLVRLPVRLVITAAGLLASTGVVVAVLAPVTWLAIAGLLLVGFAISPVIPSALSLAGRSAPGRAGQAVAFVTAVGYSSFLVGPLVVGGVASATDLRTGLGLAAVTALAVAVLGTRWPRAGRSTG